MALPNIAANFSFGADTSNINLLSSHRHPRASHIIAPHGHLLRKRRPSAVLCRLCLPSARRRFGSGSRKLTSVTWLDLKLINSKVENIAFGRNQLTVSILKPNWDCSQNKRHVLLLSCQDTYSEYLMHGGNVVQSDSSCRQ